MWPDCRGPSGSTGVAAPPAADIRISPDVRLGANTITSSRFHVPPEPLSADARTCGAPPPRSSLLSEPSAKNPIARLFGDQNGYMAPSVPLIGCGVAVASDRSQSCGPFGPDATN